MRIWRLNGGMFQVGMGYHTESRAIATNQEPGLLFMDISATNVIRKGAETDPDVLEQIDASLE